eukprot:30977-Pelagococcus_subviridis.AAC.6
MQLEVVVRAGPARDVPSQRRPREPDRDGQKQLVHRRLRLVRAVLLAASISRTYPAAVGGEDPGPPAWYAAWDDRQRNRKNMCSPTSHRGRVLSPSGRVCGAVSAVASECHVRSAALTPTSSATDNAIPSVSTSSAETRFKTAATARPARSRVSTPTNGAWTSWTPTTVNPPSRPAEASSGDGVGAKSRMRVRKPLATPPIAASAARVSSLLIARAGSPSPSPSPSPPCASRSARHGVSRNSAHNARAISSSLSDGFRHKNGLGMDASSSPSLTLLTTHALGNAPLASSPPSASAAKRSLTYVRVIAPHSNDVRCAPISASGSDFASTDVANMSRAAAAISSAMTAVLSPP